MPRERWGMLVRAGKACQVCSKAGRQDAQAPLQLSERDGYSVAVLNPRFVKPVDVETLGSFACRAELVITFEDHVLRGGFGSAVLEELNTLGISVPVVRIGWPDQFIEHGKVEQLREKYGISVQAALGKARAQLRSRVKALTFAAK